MRFFCTLLICATLAACASAPSRVPALTDSTGIAFALVPAGEFLMGSDEDPKTLARAFPGYDAVRLAGLSDEAPVHRVRITRAFWMGRHEVTV
ncbi:MAG: recombination protein RecF, partial [Variovorax sp.]|nr:recombination protein RecF [Variovorax sp.]